MHNNVPKCKQKNINIFDYYYYSEFKEIHRHRVMVCIFLHYPHSLFKNNVCFVQVLLLIKMPYYVYYIQLLINYAMKCLNGRCRLPFKMQFNLCLN